MVKAEDIQGREILCLADDIGKCLDDLEFESDIWPRIHSHLRPTDG